MMVSEDLVEGVEAGTGRGIVPHVGCRGGRQPALALTLFCAESEYPYHVRGGAPEATPCISGTIHQKVTKLLEQTYVGKCRGFKA